MVITPDVPNLPYKLIKGIKYFELVAEPIRREILPGLYINLWGYNGSFPGPTIQVFPGDYVNIRVYNKLPEGTTIHWHGIDLPNDMDGVPVVEPSPEIKPNDYFDYHFKIINPPGTHIYHTNFDVSKQQMMGLSGGFIILNPYDRNFTKHNDYFLMFNEFHVKGLKMGVVKPGIYDIDPFAHNFNFFTVNGRCYPFVTPLDVTYGERVRVRLTSTMSLAHPIHFHGHQFFIAASSGNEIPYQNRLKKNTILVASGETFDIEFFTNNPGNWPLHCHIPHHTSNNQQQELGGMFTVVKYV